MATKATFMLMSFDTFLLPCDQRLILSDGFADCATAGMVFASCNTLTGNRKPGIGAVYAINPKLHI